MNKKYLYLYIYQQTNVNNTTKDLGREIKMRDLVIKLLIRGLFQLMKNQKAEEISASKILGGFVLKMKLKRVEKYLFHMTLRKVKNSFSIDRNFNKRPCTSLPQFFIQILTFQTYPPNKNNQTLQ